MDFTVLAATSVLKDLVEKCPPAEACRDAFERLSKATIKMCLSTTGFGFEAARGTAHRKRSTGFPSQAEESTNVYAQARVLSSGPRPAPRFDMNLRALFTEETLNEVPTESNPTRWDPPTPSTPSSLQYPASQVPTTAAPYPPEPPVHDAAGPWNPAPPARTQTSAPSYGSNDYPGDLDILMSDNGSDSAYTGFDGSLDVDFSLDNTWTEVPQLELFDNFFFGGSSLTPG